MRNILYTLFILFSLISVFTLSSCSTKLTTDNVDDYFDVSYSDAIFYGDYASQMSFMVHFKGLDGWIYEDVELTVEFWCYDECKATTTVRCNLAGNGSSLVYLNDGSYGLDTLRYEVSYKIIAVKGTVTRG